MGWKLSADLRTALLKPSLQYKTLLPTATIYLIDAPAVCRSNAVGSRPPQDIVRSILMAIPPSVEHVVICFDCPLRAPDARKAVQKSRGVDGKGNVVLPELVLNAASPANLGKFNEDPVTWQQLFSTTVGKAKAYKLLHRAFREQTVSSAPTARTTLISCPESAAVWTHPFAATSPFASDISDFAYGEAEAQLAMCARSMQAKLPDSSAVFWTIDTDSLLQVALTPAIDASRISIAIARVFKGADVTVRVARDGRKRAKKEQLEPMWEIVECAKLSNKSTPAGLFFHLCAGGVDYCRGLGGFGWPAKQMLTAAASGAPTFLTKRAGGWNCDVARLASVLGMHRKSKRKELLVEELCAELDSITYCWRYYMWQCDTTPTVAGPVQQSFFKSCGAKSVSDWLAVANGTAFFYN
jgi:hypothetical protein